MMQGDTDVDSIGGLELGAVADRGRGLCAELPRPARSNGFVVRKEEGHGTGPEDRR